MWYLFAIALLSAVIVKVKKEEKSKKTALSKSARMLCRPASVKKYRLPSNIKNCSAVAAKFPDYSLCPEGCIGLHSCFRACKSGALDENLHVDASRCVSCGSCVEVCPRGLIELKKSQKEPVVLCSTALQPGRMEQVCHKGCRKCYSCLDICPEGAVYVNENGIPQTDMSKCRLCRRCVRECPSGARKMINV